MRKRNIKDEMKEERERYRRRGTEVVGKIVINIGLKSRRGTRSGARIRTREKARIVSGRRRRERKRRV